MTTKLLLSISAQFPPPLRLLSLSLSPSLSPSLSSSLSPSPPLSELGGNYPRGKKNNTLLTPHVFLHPKLI